MGVDDEIVVLGEPVFWKGINESAQARSPKWMSKEHPKRASPYGKHLCDGRAFDILKSAELLYYQFLLQPEEAKG